MKKQFLLSFLLLAIWSFFTVAKAQPARQDVIWAKAVPSGTITLDGKLDEPAWSKAQTLSIVY
ncbi:hypothetical protein ABRY23_11685, partial [Melioribacteraceae bacterium 4301-Me]|uniref:hypothetical protein n=1 Tax=Pyranulibacter aquaticus TaxID=3163344 RepID=UPI00359657F1